MLDEPSAGKASHVKFEALPGTAGAWPRPDQRPHSVDDD